MSDIGDGPFVLLRQLVSTGEQPKPDGWGAEVYDTREKVLAAVTKANTSDTWCWVHRVLRLSDVVALRHWHAIPTVVEFEVVEDGDD